jgi:adenine/guanine/hypoxanthine permease
MGAFANLPVGMAPGLGLNAYVSLPVSGFHVFICYHSSHIPSSASTDQASFHIAKPWLQYFWKGMSYYRLDLFHAHGRIRWLFVILSLLGLRQWLVRIMPQSLVLAVGAGIGLFIAYALRFYNFNR